MSNPLCRFGFVSLFPDSISSFFQESIIGRAVESGILEFNYANPRDFAYDHHRTVDDTPFGGLPGMLLKAEPVALACESLNVPSKSIYIVPDPTGQMFDHELAETLSSFQEIVFICGHYEGIDERIVEHFQAIKISIGNFVVTGGEGPAILMADAIARRIPGVLGNDESLEADSFSNRWQGGFSPPNYTRPALWRGLEVPQTLTSGDHNKIAQWQADNVPEHDNP